MRSVLIYQLAGSVMLGLSGSQLASSLDMTMPTQAALAGFALAIMLFAMAPVRALRDRVRRLEQMSSQVNAASLPPAV